MKTALIVIQKSGVAVPTGNHLGKRIIIGADHRGYALKQQLMNYLIQKGFSVCDVGTGTQERTDYTLYASKIAAKVSRDCDYNTVGIGICGSGIGMAIASAKFRGVYPARCLTVEDAVSSRRHNNSNFLAIPADQTDYGLAIKIASIWLETEFYSGEEDKPYLRRFVQTVKLEDRLYKA